MAEGRSRVLQVGPDVPGGMRTSMQALYASPLGRDFELDVVTTHRGSGAARRLLIYARALLAIAAWSLRGRGRIVHVHSTVRGSMYRKAGCVLLAKLLRRRVVFHLHSGPGDIETFRSRVGGLGLAYLRTAYRAADVVLAVSDASARQLTLAFGAEGIAVVPNAVPDVPGEPRSESREGPPLAVYLGGFANPVKGGEVLLKTLQDPAVGSLRFVLAGPGDPPWGEGEPPGAAASVGWHGWLEGGEKDALLREADVFVLASTSEGLPMVLLEAMSQGLAIVATAVGGVPDVVTDRVEALVVEPGDPDALATALGEIGADPELRRRLGEAAQRRSAEFSPEAVAERIERIYRALL
ncbi:MAG: glycosyltransferase family 4 protein [Solirubrobacterales bacterium]